MIQSVKAFPMRMGQVVPLPLRRRPFNEAFPVSGGLRPCLFRRVFGSEILAFELCSNSAEDLWREQPESILTFRKVHIMCCLAAHVIRSRTAVTGEPPRPSASTKYSSKLTGLTRLRFLGYGTLTSQSIHRPGGAYPPFSPPGT